jgi:tetratricopeptide (TPR) repeat protein
MHDPMRRGFPPRLLPPSFAFNAFILLAGLLAGAIGFGVGCAPAYEERLAAYRAEGNLDQAADLLARAAEQAPEDPAILRERGVLELERGDAAAAYEHLRHAHELNPEDARTTFYLAAASGRSGRWDESATYYAEAAALESDPAVAAAIDCQWAVVDQKRIQDLVAARLADERAGRFPAAERILMLPFAANRNQPVALNLRIGLAALLADDWAQVPNPAPVPYPELAGFLSALEVPVDEPIDKPLRERLAKLTGARYVLDGTIAELNDLVTVAPVLVDFADPEAGGVKETRLEYRQSRVATLVDLERTLLFHVATELGLELPTRGEEAMRLFAAESGLAVALYGEAVRLAAGASEGTPTTSGAGGDVKTASVAVAALGLDPEFRPAFEERTKLAGCGVAAGDPTRVMGAYEAARRRELEDSSARDFLTATSAATERVGGPEGEGEDLSLNRPAASGSASVPVRFPR